MKVNIDDVFRDILNQNSIKYKIIYSKMYLIKRTFMGLIYDIKYYSKKFIRLIINYFKPFFGLLSDDQKEVAHSMSGYIRDLKTKKRITDKKILEKLYKKYKGEDDVK